MLRGAWWRRDLNVGLGLVVAVATATAVAAPTFAGAAMSILVGERLAAADPLSTDLSWAVAIDEPDRDLGTAVEGAQQLTTGTDRLFDAPAVSATALLDWPQVDANFPVALAWRDTGCEQVVVSGRCPSAPGEVLLPAGSALATDHPAGDQLVLRERPRDDDAPPGPAVTLTVVGTWVVRDLGDDAWYAPARWEAGGEMPTLLDCAESPSAEITTSRVGPLLTDRSTLERLSSVTVLADAPLAGSTDLDRIRAAADHAERLQSDAPPQPIDGGSCAAAVSESDIDEVVGAVDERSRLERQGTGAAAGAVLIGALAVVLITSVSATRRRGEIALIKLRGVRRSRLVSEAMAEPAVSLVLGAAVGILLGWAVAAVAARVWLADDVATPLPSDVWPLVAGVVLVALVGVAAGLRQVLREPAHLQLRQARPRSMSVGGLLVRVAAFVVAAVGIYQLRREDASDPPWWAFSLPVIIGLAAGLVATWLVRSAARLLLRLSRRRRGDGVFLGSRRLVRGGGLLRFVPFAIAAVVLVVVAGGAWNVSTEWRESTALIRTGAPIAISSGRGADATLDATRRADPDGQWLMTALSIPDETGRVYRRLFVDTPRWDRVLGPELAETPTTVPTEIDPDVLSSLQAPPRKESEPIRGTRITLEATADADWYRALDEPARLVLVMDRRDGVEYVVGDGSGDPPTPPLELAAHGRTQVTVPAPGCVVGCRVREIYLAIPTDPTGWLSGTITIEKLTLDDNDLLAAPWRVHHRRVDLAQEGGGLRLESRNAPIRLGLRDTLRRLPVVTAGGLDLQDPEIAIDPGTVRGADGQAVPARVLDDVEALPLIGDEGVLGDLSTFLGERLSGRPAGDVVVLARSDTPESVRAELRASGVDTGDVRPVDESRRLLDEDPYAQGLRFFWLVAALVAVIAACAVGTALISERPVRAQETAALRVVGVGRRRLRSAVVFELGLLAGLVALCGWLGAWASTWATLPVLPLGGPAAFEPPPDATTGWTVSVVPAGVSAVLLGVAALLVLLPMSLRVRPASLRMGGD